MTQCVESHILKPICPWFSVQFSFLKGLWLGQAALAGFRTEFGLCSVAQCTCRCSLLLLALPNSPSHHALRLHLCWLSGELLLPYITASSYVLVVIHLCMAQSYVVYSWLSNYNRSVHCAFVVG